jgi:cyclophilin family peptidyl-prolyl cis-trans isomerase
MGKKSRQKILNRELKIQKQASKKARKKKFIKRIPIIILILAILGGGIFAANKYYFSKKATKQEAKKVEQITDNQIAVLETNQGTIEIRLNASGAPKTVENFVKLANDGFYNGTKFHRIIKDFMIQGGDPLSKDDTKKDQWGTGDPGYKFDDEPIIGDYTLGTVAMANSGPNTNGSQFFIMTGDWSGGKLAKSYNIFGNVISGLDVVQKIGVTKTGSNDRPEADVIITKITIKTEEKAAPSTPQADTKDKNAVPIEISPVSVETTNGVPVDIKTTPVK